METKTRSTSRELVRADEVINVKVINKERENLGKIYQIVLDKLSGQVVYIVLETGSFLGLGGKLLALPWNSIHYDPSEKAFLLNVDKEKLKKAPGFDNDHWPNFADETWNQSINTYYGNKTY